ncbi:MAG: hypothetical protein GXY05_15245 [Clostridiales bacterium]|nr:hypothetical protein [Clostridiales bacterium]
MNVTVHYPKNADDMRILQKRIATVHAQAVIGYIQKLPCPREQKMDLIKKLEQSHRAQTDSSGKTR